MLYSFFACPASYCNFEMQCFHIIGQLKESFLECAWKWVFRRHPILGTRVCLDDSSSVLLTPAEQLPPISFIYLEDSEFESKSKQQLIEYRHNRIDLTNHVIEITFLINRSGRRAYMLIVSHHLIYDGWSTGILIRDFEKAYLTLLKQRIIERPQPEQCYQKFIRYQMLVSPNPCRDFYREYLKGYQHYTKRVHSFNIGFESKGRVRYSLHPLNASSLSELRRQFQTTPAVILIAVWGREMMHCYGVDDIVVEIVFSGREAPISEIEEAVGPFISIMPIRMRAGSMLSIIESVHTDMINLHAFQHTSFYQYPDMDELPFHTMESVVVFQNYVIDESINDASRDIFHVEYLESVYFPNNYISFEVKLINGNVYMELCFDRDEFTLRSIEKLSQNIKEELMNLYSAKGGKHT